MKEQLEKDLESIAHYVREHEQDYFINDLLEGNLSPREGVDPAAWSAQVEALGRLGKRHHDFVSKLDRIAADTDGHIYCAMVRMEEALLESPVHPDAGLGLFVVSGRISGDDDDSVEEIAAACQEAALSIFEDRLRDQAGIARDDRASQIHVITTSLIGVFDRQGKLEVGADLPVVTTDLVQEVEPMPDFCSPTF